MLGNRRTSQILLCWSICWAIFENLRANSLPPKSRAASYHHQETWRLPEVSWEFQVGVLYSNMPRDKRQWLCACLFVCLFACLPGRLLARWFGWLVGCLVVCLRKLEHIFTLSSSTTSSRIYVSKFLSTLTDNINFGFTSWCFIKLHFFGACAVSLDVKLRLEEFANPSMEVMAWFLNLVTECNRTLNRCSAW